MGTGLLESGCPKTGTTNASKRKSDDQIRLTVNVLSENSRVVSTGRSLANRLLLAAPGQCTIQVEGGANEGQVGERLWEVAEGFAARARLLRVEAQVVAIAQHLFKEQASLGQILRVSPARARQRFHEPKAAHVEGSLHTRQSIGRDLGIVAIDQPIRGQASLGRGRADGVDRRQLGIAMATTSFFRGLGGAIGAAAFGAVFSARTGTIARPGRAWPGPGQAPEPT